MNSRWRFLYLISTLAILMTHPGAALAISLEFAPVAQTVNLGDQASIDLVVTDPGSTLVGGYDFLVKWDSAILSLDSIVFGTSLGLNDLFFPSDTSFTFDGLGFINAVELSFLDETFGELSALQTGTDFTLFNLTFNTLSVGTSSLDLAANIINPDGFLTDDIGLLIDPLGIGSGSITVAASGGGAPVPEPGTIILLATGLVLLGLFKRKKRANQVQQIPG